MQFCQKLPVQCYTTLNLIKTTEIICAYVYHLSTSKMYTVFLMNIITAITNSHTDVTGITPTQYNYHFYLCTSLLSYVSQVTALKVTKNNTTVTGGHLIIYMTSFALYIYVDSLHKGLTHITSYK